jgi:hypothetical protein
MRKEVPRRSWSAITGIGFVVLTVIAIALGGEPPKADDSAVDIARYLADKRDALLLSSAAWFIAAIFLLWFLGALRAHLSVDEDSDGLAATSYGGGIFGAVFLTASFCGINAGAFQIAGAGVDPLAVRGFYDFAGAFLCHVWHRVRGVFLGGGISRSADPASSSMAVLVRRGRRGYSAAVHRQSHCRPRTTR